MCLKHSQVIQRHSQKCRPRALMLGKEGTCPLPPSSWTWLIWVGMGSSALEADLKHHPDQQCAPRPALCPRNGIFVLLPCRQCVGPACCVGGGAGLCPVGPSTLCAYPGHSPLAQGESILTVLFFFFFTRNACTHLFNL